MVERTIKLCSVEQVKKLVELINSFDFNVYLSEGNYTVNAKSIMRVFCLDFNKEIKLTAECDADSDFVKELNQLSKIN